MANKYRKKAAKSEKAAEKAPEAREESVGEQFARLPGDVASIPGKVWDAAKAVISQDASEVPGAARAALESLPNAVPGGQFVVDKLRMAAGQSGEEILARREELEREHPIGTALGDIGGIVAGGAVLPAAKAASTAGRLAVGAAQAAMLTPAYKLGQVADQAMLRGDALHAESIANAFSLEDSLEAAGLTLALGAPLAAMEVGSAVGQAAGRRSKVEAAKLFEKSASALGSTPEAVGEIALQKGLLKSQTATKKLLREAGSRMANAAKQAQLSSTEIDQMALDLVALEKQAQNNQFLTRARKDLRAQAARLLSVQSGTELEGIIQSLKGEARAAYKAGKAQKGEFFGDAAETLRNGLAKHLDVMDPAVGAEYRSAVQDYNTYTKMAPEAASGARKQLKGSQVAQAAGRAAVAPIVGTALGGPLGTVAGLAVDVAMPRGILSPVRGKNTAVFMQKVSQAAPGQQHIDRANQVVESLIGVARMGTVAMAQEDHPGVEVRKAEADVPKKYAQVAKALRSSMADSTGTAQKIRAQLDFLPPHVADAVTANSMNKLQCLALELPPEVGPATAFGITTDVPDRAKREFLRRASDAFDPYGAVLSGSPMRVREAEKYNPETINDLRKRVIDKIAENPKLPYSTKRRVAGILGVAGVPTQDPMVGATVQNILRKRREAQDSQGQMKSARQANANLKNNSATLTRAQKILNQGE